MSLKGLKDHVQKYADAWARGAADRDPREGDALSLRAHHSGLQARHRAIDRELERLGVVLGPDTLASVVGRMPKESTREDTIPPTVADVAPTAITETVAALDPFAPTSAPIPSPAFLEARGAPCVYSEDSMLAKFSELRARHLAKTSVPDGTSFVCEYLPDGTRQTPQPGTSPVRHSAKNGSSDYTPRPNASDIVLSGDGPHKIISGTTRTYPAILVNATLADPYADTRDLVNPYPLD